MRNSIVVLSVLSSLNIASVALGSEGAGTIQALECSLSSNLYFCKARLKYSLVDHSCQDYYPGESDVKLDNPHWDLLKLAFANKLEVKITADSRCTIEKLIVLQKE